MDKDLYSLEYFNEEEKQEIRDIESTWKSGNRFSFSEEERLMAKLKDAVKGSKQRKDSQPPT